MENTHHTPKLTGHPSPSPRRRRSTRRSSASGSLHKKALMHRLLNSTADTETPRTLMLNIGKNVAKETPLLQTERTVLCAKTPNSIGTNRYEERNHLKRRNASSGEDSFLHPVHRVTNVGHSPNVTGISTRMLRSSMRSIKPKHLSLQLVDIAGALQQGKPDKAQMSASYVSLTDTTNLTTVNLNMGSPAPLSDQSSSEGRVPQTVSISSPSDAQIETSLVDKTGRRKSLRSSTQRDSETIVRADQFRSLHGGSIHHDSETFGKTDRRQSLRSSVQNDSDSDTVASTGRGQSLRHSIPNNDIDVVNLTDVHNSMNSSAQNDIGIDAECSNVHSAVDMVDKNGGDRGTVDRTDPRDLSGSNIQNDVDNDQLDKIDRCRLSHINIHHDGGNDRPTEDKSGHCKSLHCSNGNDNDAVGSTLHRKATHNKDCVASYMTDHHKSLHNELEPLVHLPADTPIKPPENSAQSLADVPLEPVPSCSQHSVSEGDDVAIEPDASRRNLPPGVAAEQRRDDEDVADNSDEEDEEEEEEEDIEDEMLDSEHLIHTPVLPPHSATPSSLVAASKCAQQPNRDAATPKMGKIAAKSSGNMQANKRRAKTPRRLAAHPRIPRSLTTAAVKHFSAMKVSHKAMDAVEEITDQYWRNLFKDLEAFAAHAGHSAIDRADMELLMRRQGLVSDNQSLNMLIEKYLPMEVRQELIPVARSGNVVQVKPYGH